MLRSISLLCVALGYFASSAYAQPAYPSKPIRFVVPFPPGGPLDIVARYIGQDLNRAWNQSVHRERPGAPVHVLTDAGHACYVEQPEAFNQLVLRWITG